MREHNPIAIEEFNGLYNRGDVEEVPLDHFSEANNLAFVGSSSFRSRYGIDPYQDTVAPLANILRIYNYPMATGNTQLILVSGGNIYHVINSTTQYGPILSIPEMTDFGFVSYAGRAYITPFTTELVEGMNRERGLENEFLYVYLGDGTNARTAAGAGASDTQFTPITDAIESTDPGLHIFGVVWETDTGYLTPPGQLTSYVTNAVVGNNGVSINGIEVPADARYIRKYIVASKVITNFNGNLAGYPLFFIDKPVAVLNPGDLTCIDLGFFDQELIDDASYLLDNFEEIPAGVNLCVYHNRLALCTEFDNISLIRVSQVGEPEAISQVDGFCLMPPNGDPITNIIELRDVLYSFKRNKTASFVDNGDAPSSWPLTFVDYGLGCGVHGLSTTIDSGVASVDYLVVTTYTGILLFNGRFLLPELSWKVSALWAGQTFKTDNRKIQIANDTVNQRLYTVLTDGTILYGDYANGLDPKKIRWVPWTFEISVNCVALINVDEFILGMNVT